MKKVRINIAGVAKKLLRRETIIVIAISALLFSFFVVFCNIPSQSSIEEQQTAQSAQSINEIFNSPVNAPYKIATLVLTTYSPSVKLVRFVSYIFYIGACIAMFYALRHWHTLQTSVLTTAAFATNSVLLATARLGTTLITVTSFFIFTSLLLWQLHSRSNKLLPAVVLISVACLLYTPGAIWFLLALSFVYWNRFKSLFKNVKRQAIIIGSVLSIVLMLPLFISFFRDSHNLNQWLLLPDTLAWANVPRSILRVPSAFIYRMPSEPLINVARLPVFDLSAGILFLIGLNAYRKKLKLDRTRVMIASAIIAIIVGALGSLLLSIILILPFAYSVIAAGIEFLLDEWYTVFPRNPFARSFGLIMITSVVLFSIYYQTTRFFVVWPQTPETRTVYNQSRIINRSR